MDATEGSSPDRSFPRSERLRRTAEFRAVFEAGQSHHGTCMVVFVLRDSRFTRRVGIVAGRRVGGAVQRNRAKRLLREAYRHLKSTVPPEGLHLVLVARRGCDRASAAVVRIELERLLERALRISTRTTPDGPTTGTDSQS